MFANRGRLAPALRPADYVDPRIWESERDAVFRPHWQLVGDLGSLATHGSQLACERLGVPIVVRNEAGTLVAFRNVCPHRHSLIVKPGESRADALTCQYHGWQFGDDGRLRHLPDGRSFRGFKANEACLERYRVETLGPLIFVALDSGAQPLREQIGPRHDELARALARTKRIVHQCTEHRANWKIGVENAVESYHVPSIHPETFKEYLAEEFHEHELDAWGSSYRPTAPPSVRERLAFAAFRIVSPDDRARRYEHLHIFPNLLVSYSGIYVEVVAVHPTGADTCVRESFGYVPEHVRRNPLSFSLDLAHTLLTVRATDRLLAEDGGVWESVQRGSASSSFAGVLSAREERVHHFQRFVARALGREAGTS